MTDPTFAARRAALIAAGAIPDDEAVATDEQFAYAAATPNVVVQNPTVRRYANIVLSAAGLILGTLVAVDGATTAFDLTAFTIPAFVGYGWLAGAFGLAVTTPNVPRG